jgi:hypothetical protein
MYFWGDVLRSTFSLTRLFFPGAALHTLCACAAGGVCGQAGTLEAQPAQPVEAFA